MSLHNRSQLRYTDLHMLTLAIAGPVLGLVIVLALDLAGVKPKQACEAPVMHLGYLQHASETTVPSDVEIR